MTVLKPIARSNNIGRRWMKILKSLILHLPTSAFITQTDQTMLRATIEIIKEYNGHCRKSSGKRKGQLIEAASWRQI
jgi:hypothetical protein